MFSRTYKSLYQKIEPTEKLITLTKEKMKKEQNKKHLSFYKYGAIAACFIIVLIVISPLNKNISDTPSYDSFNNYKTFNDLSSIDSAVSDNNVDSFIPNNFITPEMSSINSDGTLNSGDSSEKFIKNILSDFFINAFLYPFNLIINVISYFN